MGRLKYNEDFVKEIAAWVEENGLQDYGGATLVEMAEYFGIDTKTHHNWLEEHSLYSSSIENAKAAYKSNLKKRLVQSLSKAATGYTYAKERERREYLPTADGGQGRMSKMIKETENINVAPNVGAAIFLLTNLAPEDWQNTQRTDLSIKKSDEKEMTAEEIQAELKRLEKLESEE